jgi:hypothetical protein
MVEEFHGYVGVPVPLPTLIKSQFQTEPEALLILSNNDKGVVRYAVPKWLLLLN